MKKPQAKYEIVADDKTSAAWKSVIGQAESASKKMTSMFVGFIGGAAITQGIVNLAKNSAAAAIEIKDLSERMQLSVTEASVLSQTFNQLGGSTEALEKGFKEFRMTLSDASRGKSAAVSMFDELGISAEKLRSQKPQDQLLSISQAFEGITDPVERARIAQELFGKAGSEWIKVMGEGPDKMRTFADSVVAMDERSVEALDRSQKAWDRLAQSIKNSVVNTLGSVAGLFQDDVRTEVQKIEDSIRRFESLRDANRGALGEEFQKATDDAYNAQIESLRAVLKGINDEKQAREDANDEIRQTILLTAELNKNSGLMDMSVLMQKSNESLAEELTKEADLLEQRAQNILQAQADFDRSQYESERDLFADEITAGMESTSADIERSIAETFDVMYDEGKKKIDELNQYQIQAQRSTQSIIANFIRGGYEDGFRGVMKSFGDMLLDMAAQAMAADIAGYLFGNKSNKSTSDDSGVLTGVLSGLMGFANGGSFKVGGSGGTDSQLVAFKASPDETVSITKPGQGGGGISVINNITIPPGSNITRQEIAMALQQTSDATVARLQDMKRRNKF